MVLMVIRAVVICIFAMRICKLSALILSGLIVMGCNDDGLISHDYGDDEAFVADVQAGQGFFNRYCSGCHGSDARGISSIGSPDIRGRTVADINLAISRIGIMGGLRSQLSQEQIYHIAVWLQTLSPTIQAKEADIVVVASTGVQSAGCGVQCH